MSDPDSPPKSQTAHPAALALTMARRLIDDEITATLTTLRDEIGRASAHDALGQARQLAYHIAQLIGQLSDAHQREAFERGWRAGQEHLPGHRSMADWHAEVVEAMARLSREGVE